MSRLGSRERTKVFLGMCEQRSGGAGGQAGTEDSVGRGKVEVGAGGQLWRGLMEAGGRLAGAGAGEWPGSELWDEGLTTAVSPDGLALARRSGHGLLSWRRSMRNCTSTASP